MNYSEARSQIQDGDHIAICGTDFKAQIIAIGQKWAGLGYPYAKHSGITYWENSRLMLAQINGTGNNSVYLSQYADHAFVVSQCPIDFDRAQLDKLLETHFPYHFFGLVQAGVRLFFSRWVKSKRVGSTDYNRMVCSTFSAKFYQLCGWRTLVPQHVAPAEMVAVLAFKFEVTP
jgi:hypothetical protein